MSLRPSEAAQRLRSTFKASVDAAGGRRRRLADMAGVRMGSREAALKRRRSARDCLLPRPPNLDEKLVVLPRLVQQLSSDDSSVQLQALWEFRHLLSIEPGAPDEEVLDCGALPFFIHFLSRDDHPQLQIEAAWALSNIGSREPDVVIQHGALPILVKLLCSAREDVCEKAALALANLCEYSEEHRDIVLQHGTLFPLLRLINRRPKLSLLRNATWFLSCLCTHYWPKGPEPNFFQHAKPVLLVLRQLIDSQDKEVLCDACSALYCLSHGKDHEAKIQAVIETGACPRLIQLLSHASRSVIGQSLLVVGNIVSGDDAQIQCIVDNKALPALLNLLITNEMKFLREKACLTIAKIMAGNKEQIHDVINGNIIGTLVHLMCTAEYDVRKEAARAIANATSGGTHDQIKYLVSQGCIKAFCDFLSHPDTSMVGVCLEGLENVLKAGEAEKAFGACEVNMYAQMIEDGDGLDKIEDLQNHGNNTICTMAVRLLETFWSDEDDVMLRGRRPPDQQPQW